MLLLTTTGRKTGKSRTVPVAYIEDDTRDFGTASARIKQRVGRGGAEMYGYRGDTIPADGRMSSVQGRTGVNVIGRLMGMILVAMAIQFQQGLAREVQFIDPLLR